MVFSFVVTLLCLCASINAALIPGYKEGVPSGRWYYKLHVTPKTWHEALLVCRSEKGSLAVINSPEEAKLFSEEFTKATIPGNFKKNHAHLGFSEILEHGKWVTVNGIPLDKTGYNTWSAGQPDHANNDEHCGGMFKDGKLNDAPCNTPFVYFCKSLHPFSEDLKPELEPVCEDWGNGYKLGTKIGHRFYKVHTVAKTWDEASLVCQSEHAHLAVINSEEEVEIYKQALQAIDKKTITGTKDQNVVMLGFHDRFENGKFVSLIGQTLKESGYDKWHPGQPDNSGGVERCGSMFWTGLLNDITCNTPYMFICEKKLIKGPNRVEPVKCFDHDVVLTDEEATAGLVCSRTSTGYIKGTTNGCHSKFYKVFTTGKTWDEALLVCKADGGSLAVITSDEESKVLSTLLTRYPPDTITGDFDKGVAMVGFHDRITPGTYVAINGKPLKTIGFEKWAPGQPDNTNGVEHCGSIYRSGLLNDLPCNKPYIYICQKDYQKREHEHIFL